MLDRIVKFSSLSSALLIFFGVLKLIIFYSAFNINIVDFLTFSEIVTSFLDDINLLIVFMVVMGIQTIPTTNFFQKKSGMSIDQFYDYLMNIAYKKKWLLVSIYVAVLMALLLLIWSEVMNLNYGAVYVAIFCWFNALTLLLISSNEGKVELTNGRSIILISLVVGFTIILLSVHDIIEKRKNAESVMVYLHDGTIISCNLESRNIYLGKTEGYIFIAKVGVTTCIPVNQISRIDFEN